MLKLDNVPETINEAIDRFIFLMQNSNSRLVYGDLSVKRALIEFDKGYGHLKLTDNNGIKSALEKYFDVKGDIKKHNEQCIAINCFYNWLIDKGYSKQHLARVYTPMQ